MKIIKNLRKCSQVIASYLGGYLPEKENCYTWKRTLVKNNTFPLKKAVILSRATLGYLPRLSALNHLNIGITPQTMCSSFLFLTVRYSSAMSVHVYCLPITLASCT